MSYDLTEIKTFAKNRLDGDITGHDYFHVDRVAQIATRLYSADHPEEDAHAIFIIQIASYLHDTIDEKITDNVEQRLAEIHHLATIQALSDEDQNNIFDTIQNMSFSKNIEHHHQLSLEGQYVQDADRIEALGAIGIARAFAYGGNTITQFTIRGFRLPNLLHMINTGQSRKQRSIIFMKNSLPLKI